MPPEFAWDEENEEHISRHDVASYEAEETMTDPERVGFDVHDKQEGYCRTYRRWTAVVRCLCRRRGS